MDKYSKTGYRTIVGLVGLTFLAACSKHELERSGSVGESLPVVQAREALAVGQDLPVKVVVTGLVRSSDRASVAAKVMGTIRSLPIDLGQRVKAGQLLVEIEAAEISAKVLQAQAQLKQAARDLEREESLLAKGASTSEIVKNLTDRVSLMEAMVEEAEVMLGYTKIRAPFDGAVSRLFGDVGSLSAPGVPLLELQGEGGFEIEAGVPESVVGVLEIGSEYLVTLPASERRYAAKLKEVAAGFDASSRTVLARFSLPGDAPVRAGQFARLVLYGQSRPAILVPETAVSKLGQMERVFVHHNGAAVLRLVKTGARDGGMVEVLSGLDAGERVVVSAEGELVDGQRLSVVR